MNNLSNEQIQNSETPVKVSEVSFNNFRVFNGNTTFDFKREDGEVADFVCIYGKNGMGKSSFFDGIEWLFSGTIYRLQKEMKNDLKNFKGNILKNKNTDQNEFKIRMKLSNENELNRSYKKTKRALNDYKPGDFIGEDKYINNYGALILPHSKIDSFVYATNPQEKYNQWGEFWDPNENERKRFNNIFKFKKECDQILKELENEKTKIEDKLKRTELKESDIKKINNIILRYNKLDQYNEIREVKYEDETLTIPEISHLSRLKEVNLKQKDTEEIKLNKVNYLYQNYESFALANLENNRLQKKVLKIDEENKIYKDRLNFIKEKEDLEKYIFNIEKRIDNFKRIKFNGEIWFNNISIYKNVSEQEKEFEKNLEFEKKAILKIEDKMQRLIKQKKKLEQNSNINKINIKKIDSDIKFVNDELKILKLKLKDIEYIENIVNIKIKEIEERIKIFDKLYFNLEIKHNRLTNKWKEMDFKSILGIERYENYNRKIETIDSQIFEIEESYKLNKSIYSDIKSTSELLSEVRLSLKNYITQNEVKECPLCNTKFNSLEELIKQINLNDIKKPEDNILQKLKNNTNMLESFSVIKKHIFEDINKELESLSDKYDKELNDLNIEKNNLNKAQLELQSKIKNYESIIFNFKEEVKLGISESIDDTNDFSKIRNIIEQEIDKIQRQVIFKEEDISTTNKEYKNIIAKISVLEKKLTNINDMYNEFIKGNLNIYEFIIKEQINNFSNIDNKLKEEKDILSETIKKIENLNDKILSTKNSINIEDNVKKVEAIKRKLDENNKFIFEYKQNLSSLNLTENFDSLNKCKLSQVKLLNIVDEKLDLLNKLLSDNTLENYNLQIESLKLKLSDFESQIKFYNKGLYKINKVFSLMKSKIETNITNKFSGMTIDSVYKRIEPHKVYTKLKYEVVFNEKDIPELYVKGQDEANDSTILPQLFYSSAQLNTVALSIFLGEAISNQNPKIKTLFIDDPIGHFDDINILGFVDLLRSIVSKYGWQIVISTHDEVFNILRKKISSKFYKSKFIKFNSPGLIEVVE